VAIHDLPIQIIIFLTDRTFPEIAADHSRSSGGRGGWTPISSHRRAEDGADKKTLSKIRIFFRSG